MSRAVDGVSKAAKREEVDVGYSLRDERQRIAWVIVVLFEQSKERTLEARRVKRTRVCNQGKSQTRSGGQREPRGIETTMPSLTRAEIATERDSRCTKESRMDEGRKQFI